jgi:hypothetical protein
MTPSREMKRNRKLAASYWTAPPVPKRTFPDRAYETNELFTHERKQTNVGLMTRADEFRKNADDCRQQSRAGLQLLGLGTLAQD